jgi:Putative auto-transporter adhesin, head GIN domain
MKKLIIGFLALSFLMTSCDDGWGIFDSKSVKGKGPVERTTRDAKDFKNINLMASANVFVTQGTAFKVEVETQKNIDEILETVVEEGVLKIKFKKGTWNINVEKLNIYVEMPTVETLLISGSGDLVVETALTGDKMTLQISGSGNIKSDKTLTAKSLDVIVSGSGDIDVEAIATGELHTRISGSGGLTLAGTSDKAAYTVSGSGDINAKKLISKAVEAHISGSGNISCHANESLDAHASGSGDITYSGNATAVTTKASGSGDISKE